TRAGRRARDAAEVDEGERGADADANAALHRDDVDVGRDVVGRGDRDAADGAAAADGDVADRGVGVALHADDADGSADRAGAEADTDRVGLDVAGGRLRDRQPAAGLRHG